MNTPKDQQSQAQENECSDTWIYLAESEASAWQPSNLGEYEQRGMRGGLRLAVRRRVVPPLSLWKSTPMPNESSDTTSQISPSIQISEQDISQVEPLHQHKQPLPSEEFSISIPCLIKQPNQPELKGVIQKDLGARFLVNIGDEAITISKLFVYPDFDKSVGQIDKSPRKKLHPSTNNPRKIRRKKGQGNGSIYYRTVIKNGKGYQEAYYHYVENGKKRTKYIPKKLQELVQEAESQKLPVSDILVLLGGDKKNPRKSSSTLSTGVDENLRTKDDVLETDNLNPRKITPPSTRKRKQGEGTGYIECKPIKRSGKEYKQYWYHYEEWKDGDRLLKKSRYIPKRLLARVEKMEAEKVSVREILKVL